MQELTLLAVLCSVGVTWASNDVNSVCATVNPALNTSLSQLSGRWVALKRLLVEDEAGAADKATLECVTASAHGSRTKLSIVTEEHEPGLEPTTSTLVVTSEDPDHTAQKSSEVKVLAADHTKYFVLLRCDAEGDPDVASSITIFVRRRLVTAGHRQRGGWRKRRRQRRKGKWVQDYSDYTECEPAEADLSDEDHEDALVVVVDESSEERGKPRTKRSKTSKHDGYESDDEDDDFEGSGEEKTHGKVRWNKKYRKRQYKADDSEEGEEEKRVTKHARGKWRLRGHKHEADSESNEDSDEDDDSVIEKLERRQAKRKWRQKERQKRRKLRKESQLEAGESHDVTGDLNLEIDGDDELIEAPNDADQEVPDVEVDAEGSGDVTTDDEADVTSSGDGADGHEHRGRRKKPRKRKNKRRNKHGRHSLGEAEVLEIGAQVARVLGKSTLQTQALDTSCLSYKKHFKKKGRKYYRKKKYRQ